MPGGYTGLMRCANVADTGSLKVLFGLIKLDNPLTLLQAVYPTEKNTVVYGPLRGLDTDTWNKWVGAVGSYGSYGNKLQALGEVNDQEQLNEIISQYAYGYAVTAGRSILASKATQGGFCRRLGRPYGRRNRYERYCCRSSVGRGL